MRQVWILHNPLAGGRGSEPRVDRVAEALARRGLSVRLERSPVFDDLRLAARAAVAAGADAVLAAGGDGTVGAIAGEIAGSPVAFGALPTGTANVWAREIGLPRPSWRRPEALVQAALQLLDGQIRPADMGRCNEHPFLMWAGVGLDAFVTDRLARLRPLTRKYGVPYNTAVTFLIATEWRGADLRLEAESVTGERSAARELSGRYLVGVVTNIDLYGGGLFRLQRGSRLDDGLMDMWLFEGRTYGEALAHVSRLWIERHAAHPGVTRLTVERVEIYTAEPQAAHVDGEPLAPAERITIQVAPRAVRLLVPSQLPRRLFNED